MERGTRETPVRYWQEIGLFLLLIGLLSASGCDFPGSTSGCDFPGSGSVTFFFGPGTQHTLTIRYHFENGSTAAPSYEALLRRGKEYSVVSPVIGGFTANLPVVTGTMPAMDAIRTVVYTSSAVTEYSLTVTSAQGGSVTVPGVGTYRYSPGTVVDLVAVAEEANRFTSWSGDTWTINDVNAATTTVMMTGNITVTANFAEGLFSDPNLEQAVREAIGKPTGGILPSDLLGLAVLRACNRGIVNLEGLQYCVDLIYLVLSFDSTFPWVNSNEITDLTPLAGLTNLKGLYLDMNNIVDLAPLAGLTNLTGLYLFDNQIVDLAPLSSLTNLTELGLDRNQIVNLTPLAGLTNLTGLWLSENQIVDLTPLSGLTNLWRLALGGNQIVDVTPLSGLTNLTRLELSVNQIVEITPLADLTNLMELGLDRNFLDLTPGSPAMQTIVILESRGTEVRYVPQY